jgi:phenylalanyl-tRNA synthetase beta chain
VAAAKLSHAQLVRRRAEDVLVGRGLFEIAGWSFTEPAAVDRLRIEAGDPRRDAVRLQNPLSDAQSILRPTILISLLDAARHNIARGLTDLGLFESGTVYRAAEELADEHHALGALCTGRLRFEGWRGGPEQQADFFLIKGILAAVLDALRIGWHVEPGQWPFLHPGRSAKVLAGDTVLGFVGEVHPIVARNWEIDQPLTAFAIDLGKAAAAAPEVTTFTDVSSFPSLRQDLAVVVADDVPAARVLETVRGAGRKLLAGVDIFDVYTGDQIGDGRVSLALHLEFRAPDRTLTDEDVAPVRDKIVAALQEELGGELRG